LSYKLAKWAALRRRGRRGREERRKRREKGGKLAQIVHARRSSDVGSELSVGVACLAAD